MTIKTLFEQQKYKSSSYYIKLFLNKNKNRGKIYNTNNKTKLKELSVSNIRDIAFYECPEIMRTRNFTIFTLYAISFGQFMAAFHFF